MAAPWKRLFPAGSLLVLLVLLSTPCFAGENIVFGPRDMKISRLHLHLSFHAFPVDAPGEGLLLVRKKEGAEKIRGGFVLLNQRIIGLQDFLGGNEEVYERKVDLRSRNLLTVFLAGSPGAAVSVEIRTVSSFFPSPEVEFTAEPPEIKRGETSTLRWTTTYADTIWIDPGIGAVEPTGLMSVSPGKTTEYLLTATGKGGSATRSVKVEVREGIDITIASPVVGEKINGTHVLVKGTIGHAIGLETGINVNGVIALVHEGEFAASGVPLEDGENVITAIAVDRDGKRAETSVTVQAYVGQDEIRITAEPESGILPFESVLKVDGTFNFTQPSLSYTGPGEAEFLENLNANEYSVTMSVPGLYTFTVEARDDEGRAYTDSIVVQAMDGEVLDALLKQKWNGMKDALGAGDVATALGYIAQGARNMFEYNFTLLSSYLGEISAGLRNIEMVQVDGRTAEYEMWADQGGETYSFYVLFVKDHDGIWRIEFF